MRAETPMRIYSNRHRPHHLGPLPFERLRRAAETPVRPAHLPPEPNVAGADSVAAAIGEYAQLFAGLLDGEVAPAHAPVPDDPQVRADNLKASAYFLDAGIAGCCAIEPGDWLGDPLHGHSHALLLLVEFGREPDIGKPGAAWIRGANGARTDMRAGELAAVLAGYIRALGFSATGHSAEASGLDLASLAQRSGVARANEDGLLQAPFLKRGFRLAAVSTEYAIAADLPLSPDADLYPADPDIYMGTDGTLPGWRYAEEEKRPLHLGRYPMETIKRVDQPTTLVIENEIGRVSKRGDFFSRALAGDMGERPKGQRQKFAFKHPLAAGMRPLIQDMVPL